MKSNKLKLELIHLLIPLSVIFVILSFIFAHNSFVQFELIILFALIVFMNVSLHHHFDKSLTVEAIAEYILVAVLAIIIVMGGILI
jgi:hypothetical protein